MDHDLLIEIKTKVESLGNTVKDFHASGEQQLSVLRAEKASALQCNDHEVRIRSLESWLWRGLGALFMLQLLGFWLVKNFPGLVR